MVAGWNLDPWQKVIWPLFRHFRPFLEKKNNFWPKNCYHKLSENVWVWGSGASRSEIWSDVTMAGQTTNNEQGKIGLLSQWTMEGWDEQKGWKYPNLSPQGVEILDFHSIFVERRRLHSDQFPSRASAQLPLLHGKAGTLQVTFLHLNDYHVCKKHYLVLIVHSSPWTNSLSRYDTSDFFGSYHNGLELQGPLWDPIRICANLLSLNTFVVVPIFYCAIFKFRRAQDLVPGIRAIITPW